MNIHHKTNTSTRVSFPATAGDMNIYHARLLADQQVSYVLEFSGILDIEKFKAGLAVLHQALPMLSCMLDVHGSHFRWLERPSSQDDFSMVSEPADSQWKILSLINTPCNPETERPLKILLLRSNGKDTVCLKIDHVLSDAGGLKVLLYFFAEAYKNGKILQPVNLKRGFRELFLRFSPLAILRAARKANLPRPGSALVQCPFEPQQFFIEHKCLEPEAFDRINFMAKRVGATFNDVLLAALYRFIFRGINDSSVSYPVMVPVDMRRYLPEEKRNLVANFSSAIYPCLAEIPGETFSETLGRVKACMDAFKEDSPGLGATILMTIGALNGGQMMQSRYQQAAARGSRFINFTNFGVPVEQAYGVGPIQYAPGILVALSTYRKKAHFVVQGNDSVKFQPFIHAFLTNIVTDLEQAASG